MGGHALMDAPPPPPGFTIDPSSAPPPPPPGFSLDAPAAPSQPSDLTQIATGFVKGLTSIPDALMDITSPGRAVGNVVNTYMLASDPRFAAVAKAHNMSPQAAAQDALRSQTSLQYWLDKAVGGITGTNPEAIPATTPKARIEQGVGAGLTGVLFPAEGGLTVGSMLRNAVIGGAAGAGASGASEVAPEPLKPAAAVLGGLAAGVATHGALTGAGAAADALGGAAQRVTDPILAGVSRAAAERQAATRIANAATDLPTVLDQLKAGVQENVPGSKPTTFQQTGDLGLGGLERQTAVSNPAPFLEREAEQNSARIAALGDLQSGGDPMALTATLKNGLDALDHETSADVARATLDAQDRAAGVQATSAQLIGGATERAQGLAGEIAGPAPEIQGATIRDAAEAAEQAASARARALYKAVDPDGTLTANTQRSSTAAKEIMANEPATAKPMAGEEADIFNTAAQMDPLSPARDLVALNQRVNAAMRQELMGAGRTPTYARLAQLKSAIQDNLANTISEKINDENALVQRGAMSQDATIAARLKGWQADDQAAQQTGVGSAVSGGAPAAGQPEGPTSANGAGVPPPGGPGGAPGDQGLPGGVPTFDAEAAARLRAADANYREKMGTFGRGPVKEILRKAGLSDVYRMAPEAIPARVWRKGATGQADALALVKAIGADKAVAALTDAAAESLRKAAIGPDGTLNPRAYSKWRSDYSEALKALPSDVRAKFGAAAEASGRLAQTVAERATADKEAARVAAQTIRDVEAARIQKLKDAQAGAAGRLMGASDPSEVSKMLGVVLNRPTAVTELRGLVSRAAGDPEALNGLRQGIADHMLERFVSATNGEPIKAAQLQTFLRSKKAALEQVFTPAQIEGMDAIAQDLKRSQMSQTGAKLKGGSNTAQDTIADRALANKALRRTMLEIFVGGAGGSHFGPVGTLVGALGVVAVDALRSAGIRNVDEIVTRAMLDPEFAHALLKRLPAEPGNKASASFAQAARASAGAVDPESPKFARAMPEGQPPPRMHRGIDATPIGAPSADEAALVNRVNAAIKKVAPFAEPHAFRRIVENTSGETHEALGMSYRDGMRKIVAWSLGAQDPVGVGLHEAVHTLKDAGLFKPEEWSALTNAAQKEDWVTKYRIPERYGDLTPEGQAEEAIAERFAAWKRGDYDNLPAPINAAFERLAMLLAHIADVLRQTFGRDVTADDVLSRMRRGEVGRRAALQ